MRETKRLVAGLLVACGLLLPPSFNGQQTREGNDNALLLELGKPVEREITDLQSHNYLVKLVVGQFLQLLVDQRGVDVVVAVFGPNGEKLMEVDSPNGTQGPEPVLLIATAAGHYRFEVRTLESGKAGKYAVKIEALHAVTEQDREQIRNQARLDEAQKLEEQGSENYQAGRYAEAIAPLQRALEIREMVLGPEHPLIAPSLNVLAGMYRFTGDYDHAEKLYQRGLAIAEKVSDGKSKEVGALLNNLAVLYREKGDDARAKALYERALAIAENNYPPDDPTIATTLNNLGVVYGVTGDYVRAEQLLQRALASREKTLGAEDPDVAQTLNNLAVLYEKRGDYDRAKSLYKRALAIREKVFGAAHPIVAQNLGNLGELYVQIGYDDLAESLLQRALAIYEKALPDHPELALVLNNLALIAEGKGDYDRSESLYQRALAIGEKVSGPEQIYVAQALGNLGRLYIEKGDYARAEQFLQRALMIREKTLDGGPSVVATVLENLAWLYEAKGDFERAVVYKKRSSEMEEITLSLILSTGSQQQKQLYMNTLFGETAATVSLHVKAMPHNADAARLALTTILQRKGRALDAMAEQIGSLRLRANTEDQKLFDQLTATRTRLATLQLSNTGKLAPEAQETETERLEAELEKLEGDISRRSAGFRAAVQPITLDAVHQAIPSDAALVEVFVYYPHNVKGKPGEKFGQPRYVAYVLLRNDAMPHFVELGDVESIDELGEKLRDALHDPRRKDYKSIARQLDERVMRPIRTLLGSKRSVFLAPDGALNLIPFAALVDESGKYLIENYSINYLTSGRDLLRLQITGESREAPMVFANPLYDLSPSSNRTPVRQKAPPSGPVYIVGNLSNQTPGRQQSRYTTNQLSRDFDRSTFKSLPGTAAEASDLARLFPTATLWTQAQATESALKTARGPRFLHIASHGYFLEDLSLRTVFKNPGRGGIAITPTEGDLLSTISTTENPLLRSGLILTGVKQQSSGPGEDGVLTALEIAGLDLWGTKLVVLSACETGLGDVKNGEGVYGLRRALVLAGSETQVMSLWKVSDAGTHDLMMAYYTRLQAGEGRTEALRQVQLAMLRGQIVSPAAGSGKRQTGDTDENSAAKDYRHPYYWAAFIPSGNWHSMDGK